MEQNWLKFTRTVDSFQGKQLAIAYENEIWSPTLHIYYRTDYQNYDHGMKIGQMTFHSMQWDRVCIIFSCTLDKSA